MCFFSQSKKNCFFCFCFFFFLELKSFKLKYLVRHMLKPLYTSQTNCAALPLTHISKTNCIFLQSFQEFHNCFPRLLRCWMWLYLKERERGISALPATQTVWQPGQLLLKPGLWTQSAACLSWWHQTYYRPFFFCAVGAAVRLVKQSDGVCSVDNGREFLKPVVPTWLHHIKIS